MKIFLLFFFISLNFIYAQKELNWKKFLNGPDGGLIYDLQIDVNNTDKMYVIAYGGNLYTSNNRGDSWEYREGLKFTSQARKIKKDPYSNNVFVLGDKLYKSTDDCNSFYPVLENVTNLFFQRNSSIYASVADSILMVSFDAGENWEVRSVQNRGYFYYGYRTGNYTFSNLVDGLAAYFKVDSLYVSYDYAKTWIKHAIPLKEASRLLMFDVADSNLLYLNNYKYNIKTKEFKTTSYYPIANFPYKNEISAILSRNSIIIKDSIYTFISNGSIRSGTVVNDTLYFVTEEGFFVFTPDRKLISKNKGIKEIEITESFQRNDSIFYSTEKGMYVTTLLNPENCIKINNLNIISVQKAEDNILFGMIKQGALMRSNDGGYNWELISTSEGYTYFKKILFNYTSYISYYGSMLSKDFGSFWEELPFQTNTVFSDSSYAYLIKYDSTLYSTNDFITYTPVEGAPFFRFGVKKFYNSYNSSWILNDFDKSMVLSNNGMLSYIDIKHIYSAAFAPSSSIFAYYGMDNKMYIMDSYNDTDPFVHNVISYPFSGRCYTLNDDINKGKLITTFYGNYYLDFDELLLGSAKEDQLVNEFQLFQNYPNPFNPITTIKFSIPNSSLVELKVYDVLGKEKVVLLKEEISSGEHSIIFNSKNYNLSSGVYFYQLKVNDNINTKKFVLLK